MNHKRELAEAVERFRQLESQKAAIEKQMRGWAEIIEALQFLVQQQDLSKPIPEPPADLEPLGLTDAIRSVLREHRIPMTATDVRDDLEARGITGSSSKNLLINVHTVLGRLKTAGEVAERINAAAGKKTYTWLSPMSRALKEVGFQPIPERPQRKE